MPPRLPLPRLALPLPPWALALLAVLFVLPGLAAHDLWKTEDAIALGIVHGMAQDGELLVPGIAGLPWMHDPPLFHWVALGFGTALAHLLEFATAARLASGLFLLVAFCSLYAAARRWPPADEGRATASAAVLLALGCVGLMVHAHTALPELAQLAAIAAALAALPYAIHRPLAAGVGFGAALGLAFLSSTWAVPAALALAALAAGIVTPQWRQRRGTAFLAAALVAGILVSLSWPLALALNSPHAFLEWWTIAFRPDDAPLAKLGYLLETMSWLLFPAWLVALWTAWSLRRRWSEPRLFVPGVAILLTIAGLTFWEPPREVNLIPLIAPLALLGAQGILLLRRGAAAAFDWFGVLGAAFLAGLLWLGYVAMMTGVPPRIANNLVKTAPGWTGQFELLPMLFALALTLGWLYVVVCAASSPLRSVTRWGTGIVLLWGLFAVLFIPWADYQKSYRGVALQLRSNMPIGAPCVTGRQIGVSQAAALDYYAGIRTERFDPLHPTACPLMLVQGAPGNEFDGPSAGWTKLVDVGRPGDRSERYRLYVME
ncbi:MAG TPA: glycosyltransferase family 39 protein [Burkholderiales bacterium]|nr:glycosyltransferase family 39 protein [Burkholderiales bacterium]